MRFLQRYNSVLLLWLLLVQASCSSYKELAIDDRVALPAESSSYIFTDSSGQAKPVSKSGKEKSLLISSKKYLASGNGFSPEADIMNIAVAESLKGNYSEAEILLKEIQENVSDGSVENNLGVIYELTKRKKDAMKMYTKAVIISPDNSKFRSNLVSYINHNKFVQRKN